MPVEPLTLRPDRGTVTAWTLGAAVLTAGAVWILLDSDGHALAWVLIAVAATLLAWFGVQAVAPRLFTLRLDDDRLHGRMLAVAIDVAWDDVRVARIARMAGEPVLELHNSHSTGVLLPTGSDLTALHTFLASRLGRSGGDA